MDVRIRMYKQGLGDCFLLTFPKNGGKLFHMLIDCGVLTGQPGGSSKLAKVAQNIKDVTNNHIDLLVITHEHWDHLSGFHYKKSSDILKKLQIDRIWFSWMEGREKIPGIERKEDSIALVKKATEHALRQMAPPAGGVPDLGIWSGVQDLLALVGVDIGLAESNELSQNLRNARDFVRDGVMRAGVHLEPEFLHPGEPPLTLDGVDGIRIYALGPPEDLEALYRMEDDAPGVMYLSGDRGLRRIASALQLLEGNTTLIDRNQPFDISRRRTAGDLQSSPGQNHIVNAYQGWDMDWRKIDDSWLRAVGDLALQMDSYTNNTSLAFAIELVESKKVLLFPADAQVGNWESWEKLSWEITEADGSTLTVTTKDLLERTVFYKVGHHGSHNGTLKNKGLELMKSKDLVAMIPVVRTTARKHRPPWNMPKSSLYSALLKKTRGRVVRMDKGILTLNALKKRAATKAEFQNVTQDEYEALFSAFTPDESKEGLWWDCHING